MAVGYHSVSSPFGEIFLPSFPKVRSTLKSVEEEVTCLVFLVFSLSLLSQKAGGFLFLSGGEY